MKMKHPVAAALVALLSACALCLGTPLRVLAEGVQGVSVTQGDATITQLDESGSEAIESAAKERCYGFEADGITATFGNLLSSFSVTGEESLVTLSIEAPSFTGLTKNIVDVAGDEYKLAVQDAFDANSPVYFFGVEVGTDGKLSSTIPVLSGEVNCGLVLMNMSALNYNIFTQSAKYVDPVYVAESTSDAPVDIFENAKGSTYSYSWTYAMGEASAAYFLSNGKGGSAHYNTLSAEIRLEMRRGLELSPASVSVESDTFALGSVSNNDDGTWTIALTCPNDASPSDSVTTEMLQKEIKLSFDAVLPYDSFDASNMAEPVFTLTEISFQHRQSSPSSSYQMAYVSETAPLEATNLKSAVTVTPADMTVYEGGKDGYEGAFNPDAEEGTDNMGSDSLPHPLFEITAPKGSGIDPENLVFTSGDGDEAKTWSVKEAETTPAAGTDGEDSLYYFTQGEGQAPVRVTYTGEDGEPVMSDEFTPTADLYTTYAINLYAGENKLSEVTASADTSGSTDYPISVNSGTLTVRAVDAGSPNKVTYPVAEAPSAKLEPGTAAVSAPADTTYTLNDTDVTVPAGGIALLFDGIIDEGANRTDALLKKINATSETSEAKYLDLVDTMNGNAWVKASGDVTVYWAYPEGTDKNTDFTLYHFPGLHRDDSTGGSSGFDIADLNKVDPETVEDIEKGDNGISFTVAPGGFSPFVLTWEKDEPDTPVIPPTTYHTITASAGEGGSISPSGRVTVANHGSRSFSITADEGWTVQNVVVDGVNVGPRGSYTFSDVTEDHTISVTFTEGNAPADPDESGVSEWFDTDNHYAYLHGYGDGTLFGPENAMTRAEAAQMFYNLLRDKSGGDRPVTFEDVPEDAFYAEPVRVLASLGMINGTSPTTYEPDRPITRAEFVAIAMRFSNGEVTGENIFSDVPEDAWYRDYVVGAVGYGWILGFQGEDATFGPEQQITRSQATTVANRMLGRVADGVWIEGHMGELKLFEDVPRGHFAFRDIVEATNAHEYERDGRYEEWTGLTE